MKKTVSVLIVSALFVMSAFFILASSGDSGNVVSTPSIGPHGGANLPGASYVFNMTTEDSDFLWFSQLGGGGPAGGNGSMFGTWSGTPYGNGSSTSFGYVNLGGSQDFGPLTVNSAMSTITTEFEINLNEFTSPVTYTNMGNGHYVLNPTSVLAPFKTLGMPTYELVSGYLNFNGPPSATDYTGGFLLQVQYVHVGGHQPQMIQQNREAGQGIPISAPPYQHGENRDPAANALSVIMSAYPYTVYSSTYGDFLFAFNVYTQNLNGVPYHGIYYQFASELNKILPRAGIVFFDSTVENLTSAVANLPAGSTVAIEPGMYHINSPIIITHSLTITSAASGQGNMATLIAPKTQILGAGQPRSIFQIGGTSDPYSNAGIGVSVPVNIESMHFVGAGVEIPGTGAMHLTISNNIFTNMYKEAIGYHGNPFGPGSYGSDLVISGNYINGEGMPTGSDGIFVGNAFNSTIEGNYVNTTGWAGIILTGASQGDEGYNLIYNNYVSHVPHEGIQVAFGTHDLVALNHVSYAGLAAAVPGRDAAIAIYNPNQNNLSIFGNVLVHNYEGIGFAQQGTPYSLNSMGTNVIVTFRLISTCDTRRMSSAILPSS
ncbi:MAG: right-handed parallel beta-helix repeat-containing protein [Thermoplasmataceae archaeon]